MKEARSTYLTLQISQASEAYSAALIAGDEYAASSVVQSAFTAGVAPQKILLDIICAGQRELGARCAETALSITQEHIGTEISLTQMSWLRANAKRRNSLGLSILVTAPPAEPHFLAARLIADLFLLDGWHVHFPGLSTPSNDLLSFISKKGVMVAAWSVTSCVTADFKTLLQELRKLPAAPRVIVGGAAAESLRGWKEIDLICSDAGTAVRETRALTGAIGAQDSLAQLRLDLGRQITELRHRKAMSQGDLAEGAKIDRAYLSTLENGKQNPTIAVIHRIAVSLGVSVQDLIAGASLR